MEAAGAPSVHSRTCEQSGVGAENGTERAENWVRGTRSGKRTKWAAEISLKRDATQV